MTQSIRTYRLITNNELHTLEKMFQQQIDIWNDDHALLPLSVSLNRQPNHQDPLTKEAFVFSNKTGPVAFMIEDSCSLMKRVLTGNNSNCFNPIAQILFMDLLTVLLQAQSRLLASPNIDDWFYAGSPSLALTLKQEDTAITLHLHPKWVLSALPTHDQHPPKAVTLSQALSTQAISLQLQLHPTQLQLGDLLRLQKGDVIKTDHAITTPLNLMHQQTIICQGYLGKTNAYKSIHITRD